MKAWRKPLAPACAAAALALCAALLAPCAASCGRAAGSIAALETAEAADEAMRAAAAAQAAGDHAKALDLFDSVALAHPGNALAHLQTALLLQDHAKDDASATYHLRAYLRLRPGAEKAGLAAERLDLARRRLAAAAAAARAPSAEAAASAKAAKKAAELQAELEQKNEAIAKIESDRAALAERVEALERENARLHAYMDMAGDGGPATHPSIRPLTYEVRPGDTLSAIAQKIYSDSSRSAEILDLNSEKIGPSGIIRSGMVLVMPPQ